jgi:hypothetical protein
MVEEVASAALGLAEPFEYSGYMLGEVRTEGGMLGVIHHREEQVYNCIRKKDHYRKKEPPNISSFTDVVSPVRYTPLSYNFYVNCTVLHSVLRIQGAYNRFSTALVTTSSPTKFIPTYICNEGLAN